VRGNEAVVKPLLAKKDIDRNHKDKLGPTPLLFAAKKGYSYVAKLFREKCGENDMTIHDEDLNIAMPPAADHQSFVHCDICVSSILDVDAFYHCRIRNDVGICQECVASWSLSRSLSQAGQAYGQGWHFGGSFLIYYFMPHKSSVVLSKPLCGVLLNNGVHVITAVSP
jgi:hypothetical protein